jgi:hypothetical protein
MKKILTFGADPEAVLWNIDSGQIIGASSAGFPSHGSARANRKPSLKCDGHSNTFEIETPPFTNPEAGVELFREAFTALSNYRSYHLDFLGGGRVGGQNLGGHIHFSLRLDNDIRRVLDSTLGHLGFIVCGKNQWSRVKTGHYGRYGDTESKSYGFEYRTPPSWLVSEEWTLAFLSLAYTVGHAVNEKKSALHKFVLKVEGEKLPKRYKLLKIIRHLKQEFPHIYYGRHLSPIFRTIEDHKTWKTVSNPSYKDCSLKRWKL